MPESPSEPNCYIRARRPDGSECMVDLLALEDALNGVFPGEPTFWPDSGRIDFGSDDLDELEDEQEEPPEDAEALPIDPISSHVRFEWMEEFTDDVRSVSLRAALKQALHRNKPFRNFKDALVDYPAERENWYQFEAEKLRAEAVGMIESLDWEVLEVVDRRPKKPTAVEADPEEKVPITTEEHDWILRGAWQIATRGGRTQLSLLLKGSKSRDLLKHGLQVSPAYGRLSFLTIEEIERRIDRIIRKGDLEIQYFGDLPLVVVTAEGWDRVRPWAYEHEWQLAAAADNRTLAEMLDRWRNRRRDEQYQLLDAASCLALGEARRLLSEWSAVAGKEVRARIAETMSELPKPE